jgi:hypothetical protein
VDRPKLPEDLKGQAWVAIGIPFGLAVLARAAKEIEAGLKRRYRVLAGLTADINTAAAELAALRGAIEAERPSSGAEPEPPVPNGLCIAPGCRRLAVNAWHCPDHDVRVAVDECGEPFPCAHRAHNPDVNHPSDASEVTASQ